MTLQLKRRQFTLGQYHQMIATGVLPEGDRVELIEGEILEMAAIGSKHTAQVKRLNRLLSSRLDESILISIQDPIELGPRSEPEPDVALLRWRADYYVASHPQAADVYLIIEVADSTVEFDREVKGPLYARSGIVECWLIDVSAETITLYRLPTPDGYQHVEICRRGMAIVVAALPDLGFTVDQILG